MKYNLGEISEICGGTLSGSNQSIDAVSTDSRSFSRGVNQLFIAIAGRNHDGHAYINELYWRGVRAFMIERDVATEKYPEASFIKVESSVTALQQLATDYRLKFKGRVVAITGSNGKTVVKEWIATLAPQNIKLFRSPKSYNSQIGVPLSILMIEGNESVAVIEAGISRMGEMELLECIIRPEIGVITTLGDAHQENFDSLEQKLSEKLKLFKGCKTIIYNSHYTQIAAALNELYPSGELCDAAGQKEAYAHFGNVSSQENAATAIALCDTLGYDHAQIVGKLDSLQSVAMRLELKEGLNDSIIINDSYNSDINSLTIAIDYLKNVAAERKLTLILSDILQSGFAEKELYSRVAQLVEAAGIDHLVGIGERIKLHSDLFACNCNFFPTTESYISAMKREDVANRAILIKGNRSSQFERLSHSLERKSHTTTLEVNLDAMIHNLNAHRAMLKPQTRVMAMVKAAAYGNGTYEVANMLQTQGVDYLAVAFADEGVTLRERGITMPIVVLNADADSFELMVANSLEPEIYSFSSLNSFIDILNRYGERSYPIHIKVDSGMHRLGFEYEDTEKLSDIIEQNSARITVSTIFSHLSSADDSRSQDFTMQQKECFDKISSAITSRLPYRPILHLANSAAIELLPQLQYDMVRLGIGLYGVGATPNIELQPIGRLLSRIVQIKELGSTQTVGYGRAGVLSATTRIATVPMGYADGLDRHLGCGKWSVIIGGKPAKTVGRICMDTCMVDITEIENVSEGDQVIIFGGGNGNSIEDMAHALDTIAYEVMTSISTRVKRVYIKE